MNKMAPMGIPDVLTVQYPIISAVKARDKIIIMEPDKPNKMAIKEMLY